MNELINDAFLRLIRRAEARNRTKLVETFVDAAPLLTLLSTPDHQVVYGRRGTGKTHALLYLQDFQKRSGDVAIYVDMRTVGSTGGLYSDTALSLSERGTRLLADTLSVIHEGLLEHVLDNSDRMDLASLSSPLDRLAESITEVAVIGQVEQEQIESTQIENSESISSGIGVRNLTLTLSSQDSSSMKASSGEQVKSRRTGTLRHRVHFGSVGEAIKELVKLLSPRRLWILLDEWSVIPIDLQPYLADLLRRSLLPHRGITVKIGAIEQRSKFHLPGHLGDYIGIEVGADVTADLNLDDFMVFDNDSERATAFFREMLYKHYISVDDLDLSSGPHPSVPTSLRPF